MSGISHVKPNVVSADEVFVSIKASWNKAVGSILETAQTLKAAEEQLPRVEFLALKRQLQNDRVMSNATISKLIKIGSNDVLTAPDNVSRLPASYATLYEIAQYDGSVIQGALEDGLLSPSTQRKDVKDVMPARGSKKIKTTRKTDRISISVRFSANTGVIPEDLLEELQDVLKRIEAHTDVKISGV